MKERIDESGKAHAALPPSASGRWGICAPSMAYVDALVSRKIIVKRKSGDAAMRGTRIHSWGEQFIKWMLKGKNTRSVQGDEEELAEAREYAELCVRLLDEANVIGGEVTYGIEDRSRLDDHCWGSTDFWYSFPGWLVIVDLKSGYETVGVANNSQLLIYAVELFERFRPRFVEICVWQPNGDDGSGPFRSHVYTADEMASFAKTLRDKSRTAARYFGKPVRSMEPDLVAGDHCKWCDALGVCPAARRHNQEISRESFMPVPTKSKNIALRKNTLLDASQMTPEQVGDILSRAPLFAEWIEAVRIHALELMSKGKSVPGFKPVAMNTRYKWEGKLTPQQIATKLGLRRSDVVEEKLLSPSKVRAKVKDKKKAALIERMTWRPFEITLAKDSDRRTAIPSTKISFQPVSKSEENDDE